MNCKCWYNPETGQREYCATHEAEVRAQPPSEAKEQPSFPAQSNALPTVPYVAPAVGFVPIGTPVSTVKPAVQPWMEATAKEYCGDSVSFTYKRTHLIEVLTRLAPAPAPDETGRNLTDNYVAWLTFEHHSGNRVSIHVCDSDTKGAFKVYRHAPAPPPDVTRLVECATRVVERVAMSKFRKKPVVIEAWDTHQLMIYARSQWMALPQVIRDQYEKGNVVFARDCIFITTLEGVHRADPSDKIICGVKGELYPCKRDIFNETYEVVEL